MRKEHPDIAIRTHVDLPERLLDKRLFKGQGGETLPGKEQTASSPRYTGIRYSVYLATSDHAESEVTNIIHESLNHRLFD